MIAQHQQSSRGSDWSSLGPAGICPPTSPREDQHSSRPLTVHSQKLRCRKESMLSNNQEWNGLMAYFMDQMDVYHNLIDNALSMVKCVTLAALATLTPNKSHVSNNRWVWCCRATSWTSQVVTPKTKRRNRWNHVRHAVHGCNQTHAV